MKKLLFLLFFLLATFPASADVAYEPPGNSFYEEHRSACARVERDYYSNGQEGYIALWSAPNGLKTKYLSNGIKLRIHCTYENWAMVTHQEGTELSTPVWTELPGLYLIYDCTSFLEEHKNEIQNVGGKMLLPEGAEEIYYYEYPGAANPRQYSYFDESIAEAFSRTYSDPEGRRWGYITYYRGLRNKWICLDDPLSVIPPFGGDSYLGLIDGADLPETFEPAPESGQTDSPIVPPKDPPRIPWNPMPLLAILLVSGAVVAAIVLIAVCYKKK